MPIEQVERIEVIRGPRSSVYGEYAYARVINVVTRQRERTLHAQGGEDAGLGGGGVWYWQDPRLGLTSSVNVVGIKGNGGTQLGRDWRVSDRLKARVRRDAPQQGAFASPRGAALWRIDEQNILKFQFARAFRPPTFYEQACR